jgi:hypothetical protein
MTKAEVSTIPNPDPSLDPGRDPSPERYASLNAIALLMDYAIVEGAELRLPIFVFLVRLARLELGNAIDLATPDRTAGSSDETAGETEPEKRNDNEDFL